MSKAPQIRALYVGEERNVAVDFSGKLDDGETLKGIPTVSAVALGLVVSGEQVNSSAISIDGTTVDIGRAVQFSVNASNASAGTIVLLVSCSTSASQVVRGLITVRVQSVS